MFEPTDALTAADQMVLFRNGVRQALRRAGYHASFVCRPPFPNVMASGWHLHQSLVDRATGRNAFCRARAGARQTPDDAGHTLSDVGAHYLAGLLAHGRGMAAFCTPTDQRLRALPAERDGAAGGDLGPRQPRRDAARPRRLRAIRRRGSRTGSASRRPTRTSTSRRRSTPGSTASSAASPPGRRRRRPTPAAARLLPTSLGEALDALGADAELVRAFGPDLVDWFVRIKRAELLRHDQADDKEAWQAREYFSRF